MTVRRVVRVLGYGPWLVLVLTTSLGLPAGAGTYQVGYSGGMVDIVGPSDLPWSKPYSGSPWYGGESSSCDPPPNGISGPGSVHCHGAITVTFTWQASGPSDPPPTVAILQEDGNAMWLGESGSCDNGPGDPEFLGVSTGTHYTVVQNPGPSYSFTRSPSAFGVVANPGGEILAAIAGVSYKGTLYPVRLNIAGLLDPNVPSKRKALTGQRVRANINMGGFSPSGQTRFSWAVTGASPFRNYAASTQSATYDGWGHFTEFTGSVDVFFAKPDVVAVSCMVETITPSLSMTVSTGFTISAPKRFHEIQPMGAFKLHPDTHPTSFFLSDAEYPGLPKRGPTTRNRSGRKPSTTPFPIPLYRILLVGIQPLITSFPRRRSGQYMTTIQDSTTSQRRSGCAMTPTSSYLRSTALPTAARELASSCLCGASTGSPRARLRRVRPNGPPPTMVPSGPARQSFRRILFGHR